MPWTIVHVPPRAVRWTCPEPGFSLTHGLVGLWRHPEIVMFDVPRQQAAGYLGTLARRIEDGAEFRPGRVLHDLHEHFRFALVAVTDTAVLGRLAARAGRSIPPGPVVQLVWPDICGTLPWEHGYDPAVSGLTQPVLGPWPGRTPRG